MDGMQTQTMGGTSEGIIWELPKSQFIDILKQGGIAGAVAGAFTGFFTLLASVAAALGIFIYAGLGLGVGLYNLITTTIWGGVWGAAFALLIFKFYEQIPLEGWFKKVFIPFLVLDILFGIGFIFGGWIPFVLGLIGTIGGSYIFAKMTARSIGIKYGRA